MANEEHARRVIEDMVGKHGSIILPNLDFTYLPPEIGKLEYIASIDFSGNKLTNLPPQFSKLKNLAHLDLSSNAFESIPGEIADLKNLVSLNLSQNMLTAIPRFLNDLPNLGMLDLQGNQLPIPPEILQKTNDPSRVLSYYFSVVDEKKNPLSSTRPLNEIKVLFVGQGSVGKTSLIRRLVANEYSASENKTEGIIINKWLIKVGDSRRGSKSTKQDLQIGLNLWDFGGQEIMHATHQFFLTRRSLYILVLDARLTQEENRLEYWIKIINSFGGDSPILVVGNKIDQHPLDIDRTGIRRKYPNVVNVIEVSAATGKGAKNLMSSIIDQVLLMSHVRDLLPNSWFEIKSYVERLGKEQNFIEYNAYVSICEANNVHDEISQRTLVGFLHDLGVILHFQDDPRLEALGILNPEWVTNGVYKILNSHALFQNKGILTISLLDDILRDKQYPHNKRIFIVDMMRKFELCYDLEPSKTFLIPDLLPKDEPFTGEWDDTLAFKYRYNVLPSSIFSRFIVRMNSSIYRTIWRTGVVLKSNGNMALVKADLEDSEITILVSGEETTKRDFLSAIRSSFKAIHNTIAKVEVRERVPIPGFPDLSVDYEHLLKLEQNGIAEFMPEGMDRLISVKKLLNGIEKESARKIVKQHSNENKTATISQQLVSVILVGLPRTIGRTVLDLFGRDKARVSTAIIVGYSVIVIGVLLIMNIFNMKTISDIFVEIWRFFFPIQ